MQKELNNKEKKDTLAPPITSDEAIETTQDMGVPEDLAGQYDRLQKQSKIEEDKEQLAIEATNPHSLYNDVVTNPAPKKYYEMTIMGRPIDLSKLEKYMIFRLSPKSTITTLRYNEVKAYEDAQAYGKQGIAGTRGKKSSIGKLLIIIVICVIIAMIGIVMLTKGPELMKMFGMGG